MVETRTKLFVTFLLFSLFGLIVGYGLRAYIPYMIVGTSLAGTVDNINIVNTAQSLFNIVFFNVNTSFYVVSLIVDAWLLLGTFTFASWIFDR